MVSLMGLVSRIWDYSAKRIFWYIHRFSSYYFSGGAIDR